MADSIFKIYNYVNNINPEVFYTPPFDHNYNIVGLSKKRIFTKGELNSIDYYGYVDSGGTYQDLVLTEYRTYYRKNRMVYKRKLHINWFLDDNTIGAHKTTYKYYSTEESIKLGERRRRNIISNMKINTLGLIQLISGVTQVEATMIGMAFLGVITTEISQFIEGVEDSLKNKILTYSSVGYEWLEGIIPNTGGITIRQYLYSGIDIDYCDVLE